ncbi:hypothetical protein [Enhygromyxa salina]|uniref:Lipoprotein n=1 Tax=Enhygromyxa salina TaxID=215803 RepID=A0A2S9XSN5_9BACT|nr:hypothetical protein [Enhygromyxa salina]PRP95711.1 hypothetical protein ENSA7_73450 [Enhygromyxa salina]
MRHSLHCSLVLILGACHASQPTSPEPAATTPSIQCFEVREPRGPEACDFFAWTHIEACFVDDDVELNYTYDIDECDPDEAPQLDSRLGHGDLSWHGRLGPRWARDLEAALDDQRKSIGGVHVQVQVRFTDGAEAHWISRTDKWRLLFVELDDVAKRAAGLGVPAPLIVVARGREQERFELQPRPLERTAELVWSGAQAGRCEIDNEVSRRLRMLARDTTAAKHAPSCPEGPGLFIPLFSSRTGEPRGCQIWALGSVNASTRLDPNLGEIDTTNATLLAALRTAASGFSP